MFVATLRLFGVMRTGSRIRLVLAVSFMVAASGIAAQSALAGTRFQRGDVFLTGNGSVQEYSPSGHLVQTVPGTSGATLLCFDPTGNHLIVPGVGLFDSSGNQLASNWASVTVGGTSGGSDCVADGFGNVYLSSEMPDASWTITKYDLRADPLQTFPIAFRATTPLAMALAPDECTMFYGAFGADVNGLGPFNVCTNTQGSSTGWDMIDDLRVLPTSQILKANDHGASLIDTSGKVVQRYAEPTGDPAGHIRVVSVDPDGTSFWMCCYLGSSAGPTYGPAVLRFDISSGRLLAEWLGGGAMAVYGPPLLGNANIQSTVDTDAAGTAEAFTTRAGYSGQMSRLHLYVDPSSTASQVIVGVYSDRNGHPGTLQEQAKITNVKAGSWNYVSVPSRSVTAGQRYWIAVLGPSGGGTIRFRDGRSGSGSETSAQQKLSALPSSWSRGNTSTDGPLSAYGS